MRSIEELQSALEESLDADQSDTIKELCQQIVAEFPQTLEAARAGYQLGLEALESDQNLQKALDYFNGVLAIKDPFWTPIARTSAAICWRGLGKKQKSMLELRRVAMVDTPTEQSMVGMTMLSQWLLDDDEREAWKANEIERLKHLGLLIDQARAADDRAVEAYYQWLQALGLAGQGKRQEAKAVVAELQALGGEVIGDELFELVQASEFNG